MEGRFRVQESTRDRENQEHGQDHWETVDSRGESQRWALGQANIWRQMKNERGREMIKGHFRILRYLESFWLIHKLT